MSTNDRILPELIAQSRRSTQHFYEDHLDITQMEIARHDGTSFEAPKLNGWKKSINSAQI